MSDPRSRSDCDDDDDDGGVIGPALPPSLVKRKEGWRGKEGRNRNHNSDDDDIGPALPPHLKQRSAEKGSRNMKHATSSRNRNVGGDIGPALPPHLLNRTTCKDDDDEGRSFGVQLPPNYSRTSAKSDEVDEDNVRKADESESEDDSYGPALPPGFQEKKPTPSETESDDHKDRRTGGGSSSRSSSYGPSLPPSFQGDRIPTSSAEAEEAIREESDDDSEDDMIGPMPMKPGTEGMYARSAAEEFEKRSAAMRQKLSEKDGPTQVSRDSWMTELPGYSTTFGLGARTFRKTPLPEAGDRSVWTDTPADRARKEQERAEKRLNEEKQQEERERRGKKSKKREETELSERDKRLASMVTKHNDAARGESLVDMHSKKRKKELEEEEDKPKERRPFDRDIDLKANQFDDAKRKLMIKKSAQLNDRFSHSKEKMFL